VGARNQYLCFWVWDRGTPPPEILFHKNAYFHSFHEFLSFCNKNITGLVPQLLGWYPFSFITFGVGLVWVFTDSITEWPWVSLTTGTAKWMPPGLLVNQGPCGQLISNYDSRQTLRGIPLFIQLGDFWERHEQNSTGANWYFCPCCAADTGAFLLLSLCSLHIWLTYTTTCYKHVIILDHTP